MQSFFFSQISSISQLSSLPSLGIYSHVGVSECLLSIKGILSNMLYCLHIHSSSFFPSGLSLKLAFNFEIILDLHEVVIIQKDPCILHPVSPNNVLYNCSTVSEPGN